MSGLELSHVIALFVGSVLGGVFAGTFSKNLVDTASQDGSIHRLKAGALGALYGASANVILVIVLLLSILIGFLPATLITRLIPWTPDTSLAVVVLAIAIGLYPAFEIMRGI